jgi:hypothetical protein
MTKLKLTLAFALSIFLTSFIAESLPSSKKFNDLLNEAKMNFSKPKGFEETIVIVNKQQNYDYAIKSSTSPFEIRYIIKPLGNLYKEYERKEKTRKPGEANLNPNTFHATILQSTIYNISGGTADIIEMDKQLAKKEFNADWAATAFVMLDKEFGQDYKFCLVSALHKDNVGDAYCFYIANTKETLDSLAQPAFHGLKFK